MKKLLEQKDTYFEKYITAIYPSLTLELKDGYYANDEIRRLYVCWLVSRVALMERNSINPFKGWIK